MKKGTLIVIGIFIIILSKYAINSKTGNICGVNMNEKDIMYYNSKFEDTENPYEGNGSNFYEIINDSIRKSVPDSVIFEIFLSYSSEREIAITVHGPKNKEFFKKVRCSYFNSNYNSEIPEKKYLILYSYTNIDGSGDQNFEYGLKDK